MKLKVLLILILLFTFFCPVGVMAGPSVENRQQQRVEIGKDVSMGGENKRKKKTEGEKKGDQD